MTACTHCAAAAASLGAASTQEPGTRRFACVSLRMPKRSVLVRGASLASSQHVRRHPTDSCFVPLRADHRQADAAGPARRRGRGGQALGRPAPSRWHAVELVPSRWWAERRCRMCQPEVQQSNWPRPRAAETVGSSASASTTVPDGRRLMQLSRVSETCVDAPENGSQPAYANTRHRVHVRTAVRISQGPHHVGSSLQRASGCA